MSTVLWGGRKGDTQYASRDFWRRNLRIGVPTMTVASWAYLDVGDVLEIGKLDRDVVMRVDSMERHVIGFVQLPGMAVAANVIR